jgi:phosphoglycerate dehydrogenase-like enzyme
VLSRDPGTDGGISYLRFKATFTMNFNPAILINVSREVVINEKTLYKILKENGLRVQFWMP